MDGKEKEDLPEAFVNVSCARRGVLPCRCKAAYAAHFSDIISILSIEALFVRARKKSSPSANGLLCTGFWGRLRDPAWKFSSKQKPANQLLRAL